MVNLIMVIVGTSPKDPVVGPLPNVLGPKLPIFPYNRGWSSTQFRKGLYTHYKDSLLKVGGLPSPRTKELIDPFHSWPNSMAHKLGLIR